MLYALRQGLKHYQGLHNIKRHRTLTTITALELPSPWLEALGLLVLDFDGVLAPHGAKCPLPAVMRWLLQLSQTYPALPVVIFSNKPTKDRQAFFKQHFPTWFFLSGVPKKPYPQGLQQLLQQYALLPQQMALVDDRLLTGMLSTCLVGCQGLYIVQPYQDPLSHPMVERFFAGLRRLEFWIF
jgi:predicted HAD superfamily phosphohydrolase YqeG